MDLNTISLTGRLTTDPELHKSQRGNTYAYFTLACNYAKNITYFISCVCFDNIADNLAEHCSKGTRVVVSGRLTTAPTKDKRTITQVAASLVLNINESEAREEHMANMEARKEKKEQAKAEAKFKQTYDNPMMYADDIPDEDLPF